MKFREKEPAGKKLMQRFCLSEELRTRAGKHVDGIRFLNVGHIINIALAEWLARAERLNKRNPPPPTGTLT